jgi:hypothetical protein
MLLTCWKATCIEFAAAYSTRLPYCAEAKFSKLLLVRNIITVTIPFVIVPIAYCSRIGQVGASLDRNSIQAARGKTFSQATARITANSSRVLSCSQR